MELYDDYKKWVITNITALENIDPFRLTICSLPCRDLMLVDIIGKGGGSFIVDTQCNNIQLAMKLYDGNVLGNIATRDNYKEILVLLKYSLLKSICNNFLSCYGYGIGCCILLGNKILKDNLLCDENECITIKELENYRLLKKTMGSDEDILDYISMTEEEGCESFFLTDLLQGKDLATKTINFTNRMLFEYIYSLLCSAYYLGQVPGDRHLDNIFVVKMDSISVEIKDITLEFPSGSSIVHIDYQAMSDIYNVNSSIISLIEPFCEKSKYLKVKNLLDLDLSLEEKILQLPYLFSEYSVNKEGQLKWEIQ